MMRYGEIICAVAFAACAEAADNASGTSHTPTRIVSLDYCADQFVLKLADRNAILAVSPDAKADFSYMRDEAANVRHVRPLAEDVLALKPDVVVRSYGGGPGVADLFERAGVRVIQIGYASTVDDILSITEDVADELGRPEEGRELIAQTKARLNALDQSGTDARTLYVTPGGVTSGSGTLVAALFERAGLLNYETRPGWHDLPLERLTTDTPDRIAAAFYGDQGLAGTSWSAARHPIARTHLSDLPTTQIEGAWIACGGWFLVDALEALVEGQQSD